MPRVWRRARDRSCRACPHRSPMHTTAVVRLMTPTYRVKDPADADLPRSFEARSPAKEPGLLFFPLFKRTQRRGCLDAAAPAQRPLINNLHRVPRWLRPAQRSQTAGAKTQSRQPCPISGVPTHKHWSTRCACALGRPPVACSDASLACASQSRRVWTQPRWSFSFASLAQWSRAPVYEAGG